MRLSLSLKFALLSAALVLAVAGATAYLLVYRFGKLREAEMVGRDRELAQVLAGLRLSDGRVDFRTLKGFVASADRVDTGLVYAIELDRSGAVIRGALNAKVFGALDASFARAAAGGPQQVLRELAAGRIDRKGHIKEYRRPVAGGSLRLGFDLGRIDAEIAAQSRVGLVILGVGLLVGALASVVLARRLARPIRQLAKAMEAVAEGDFQQTVQVHSSDEIASLAGSFNRMMRALRHGGRIEQVVAPYLSRQVLARLLREQQALEMASEERLATVLSLALVGRSAYGTLDARGRGALLNDYLAPIIDALHAEGGLILALDALRLRAVWGVPDKVSQPERAAIAGALAARAAVESEARRQKMIGGPALDLRLGVATGRVLAGNIGSVHRVSYGVVGDAVELADAIVELSAGGQPLVTEAAYSKVASRAVARAGPPLIVEGLDEAIPLYYVSEIAPAESARQGSA